MIRAWTLNNIIIMIQWYYLTQLMYGTVRRRFFTTATQQAIIIFIITRLWLMISIILASFLFQRGMGGDGGWFD